MSLYVARSPYRSSSRRSGLSTGFLKLGNLFKKRDSRVDRSSSAFSLKGFGRARRERRRVGLIGGLNGGLRPGYATGGMGLTMGLKNVEIIGTKTLRDTLKKIKDVKIGHTFGPSTVIGGLAVFAIVISLAYLAHFNQAATKGYDLKRLQADQNQLMSQYEIKNMRLAEIKALNTIAESKKVDGMRRPSVVTFVHGNTALAQR